MLTAVDIMTEDVIGIRDSATVAQAIALMQHHKVRSLIVEHPNDPNAYGIVTERDIIYKVTALGTNPTTIGVATIMREPCIAVEPTLSLAELAQVFAETGIQRAPVIQDKALLGIVSITDILMKTDVGEQQPNSILSQRIQEALQHARIICGDEQSQISQECEVAWDVVEELKAEAGAK